MQLTEAMQERAKTLRAEWKDEGDGFASLIGTAFQGSALVYLALPEGVDTDGDEEPEVNGGLTFGRGNVVGWDFAHGYNYGTPQGDLQTALAFYRARMKAGK